MTRPSERTARASVRLVALGALLVVGVARWLALIEAPPTGAAVGYTLFAIAVAGGLLAVGLRTSDQWRALLAFAGGAIVLAAGALHAAGIPLSLLDPRDWNVLAVGLGDGIGALPGVTVPYRGVSEWVRVVIAAGGLLLAAIAALAAVWPRSDGEIGARGSALVAVGVLFAIPAIQLTADRPWAIGALFAVPLVLFLVADRLPLRLGAAAGGAVLTAVLAAMAIAPALDRSEPLVDVEEIARSLQPQQPDRFSWDHGYGPMDWPRDGTEMLRVRSKRPSYWKAQDLELFDGVRWTQPEEPNRLVPIAEGVDEHPGWRHEVRVTIRGMTTREFIAPGEALSISRAPRQPVNTRAGGFSVAEGEDDLDEGSAYLAESYVPRPTAAQLRAAPVDYPVYLGGQLTMLTPSVTVDDQALIRFMPFGSGAEPVAAGAGVGSWEAQEALERSGYGEVYALARELAAESSTPYDFARRVERHLNGPDFVYVEGAAERRLPVPAFLLRDKAGYCQHYSAAMALLMRMGGVPARVVGGFTAGKLDEDRGEYIVRDTDAHSWVEVWFAGIGWVTFDPTPSDAPARSQAVDAGLADPGVLPGGPEPTGAIGAAEIEDEGEGGGAAVAPLAPADPGDEDSALPLLVLAAIGVVTIGGWALWRRRDRLRRRRLIAEGQEPALVELERALRRTGRPLPTGTTLLQLEQRYAHSPGVRAYLRAIAARRYGEDAGGPTLAQRRALRRDLARGLGPAGRLRALWALPPRARLH